MAALARVAPYRLVRDLVKRCCAESDPRIRYFQYLQLELLWFRRRFLLRHFLHQGVERIDPAETYLLTSLHFGNFCMYGASLNQQRGIASRTVASIRNLEPGTRVSRFWVRYSHLPQILSGYPVCHSTDTPFQHIERLNRGVSLNMLMDPREQGFEPREHTVDFLERPLRLQRAVPLLARRARVRILPYIGYYDRAIGRHRVTWFPPLAAVRNDRDTLQGIVSLFEEVVAAHPTQSFNVL